MIKIIYLRNPHNDSKKPEVLGKAGRLERMFKKQRKINEAWEKCVVRPSKVDSAIKFGELDREAHKSRPVDVANYRCNRANNKTITARGKEKRRCGVRELVRI